MACMQTLSTKFGKSVGKSTSRKKGVWHYTRFLSESDLVGGWLKCWAGRRGRSRSWWRGRWPPSYRGWYSPPAGRSHPAPSHKSSTKYVKSTFWRKKNSSEDNFLQSSFLVQSCKLYKIQLQNNWHVFIFIRSGSA